MPHAFVTIVDGTGILYNIAELELLMTNENVSIIVRTSRKKPTFTNDYNKRKGPNFGSQNYHNSNSQHNSNSSQRYGKSYSQPYNRNQNFSNQNHDNQSNSNQQQNQRTGQNNYNFPARQSNNSNTQYNRNFPQNNSNALSNNVQFIDDDSQEMINSISNYFALNYEGLRNQMKKVTSNHAFI